MFSLSARHNLSSPFPSSSNKCSRGSSLETRGLLATKHATGVQEAREKSQKGKDQTDQEFHTAPEPPPNAKRWQTICANAGTCLCRNMSCSHNHPLCTLQQGPSHNVGLRTKKLTCWMIWCYRRKQHEQWFRAVVHCIDSFSTFCIYLFPS